MFPPGLSKYHLCAGKKGFDLICMCFSPVSKSADRLRPPHRRLPRRMPESALRCLRTLLAAGGAPTYPQARPVQPIALHETAREPVNCSRYQGCVNFPMHNPRQGYRDNRIGCPMHSTFDAGFPKRVSWLKKLARRCWKHPGPWRHLPEQVMQWYCTTRRPASGRRRVFLVLGVTRGGET